MSRDAAPLPPLAIYLHFPWCVAKCPYCDFNSHALRDALPEERYVAALAADLDAQAPLVGERPVVSVFMGGGTPSLFSPAAIGRVLEHARRRLQFAPDVEVTLEANPGTVERGRFGEYRAAGVNRVSLGAQSFSDARLETLGRIHRADETRTAAEELHAAGLANFNLDLMYALPGQNAADALADVEEALALRPAHLSHYQLTLEPGTLFAARPPAGLRGEDEVDAMLDACQARLAAAGFAQYEVSGYARAGAQCRHNLNYWHFGDYLGVGAGAHGKISSRIDGVPLLAVERTMQLREPRRYLTAGVLARSHHVVDVLDRPFEFMMNALRLVDGFPQPEFETRTGLSWDSVAVILDSLCEEALVQRTPEAWRPTARGLRFLNEVLQRFLPSGSPVKPVTERQGPAGG